MAPAPAPATFYTCPGSGRRLALTRRTPPAGDPRGPGLLYCPGILSSHSGTKGASLQSLARRLRTAYVGFDYSGHGLSSGSFLEADPSVWLEDAQAVLDGVSEGPQIVVGSSFGALIAIHLAAERPDRVAGLVLVSPAVDFDRRLWGRLDGRQRARLLEGHIAKIAPGALDYGSGLSSPTPLTLRFFEGARRLALPGGVATIPVACPVSIIHGVQDAVIPVGAASKLVAALAGADVSLTLLKGADHRLQTPGDLSAIAGAVTELWGRLATAAAEAPASGGNSNGNGGGGSTNGGGGGSGASRGAVGVGGKAAPAAAAGGGDNVAAWRVTV